MDNDNNIIVYVRIYLLKLYLQYLESLIEILQKQLNLEYIINV